MQFKKGEKTPEKSFAVLDIDEKTNHRKIMKNDTKTLKETLRIIEGLCLLSEGSSNRTAKPKQSLINTIYAMAHLHSSCKAPHLDWVRARAILLQELKRQRII